MRKLLVYVCLLLLLLSEKSRAAINQPGQFFYQQFDNSSGLSNSSINVVYQDSDNLLWIGSWDGLNMFDGTDFKIFNYSGSNTSGSIGNNIILDIAEGANSNIWINTIGGISRIDKKNGEIYQYFYNSTSRRKISEKEFELVADRTGTVYCYSKTDGLAKFDLTSNSFKPTPVIPKTEKIKRMILDGQGLLWLLKESGEIAVCRESPKGLKIIRTIRHSLGFDNIFNVRGQVLVNSGSDLLIYDNKLNYTKATGKFRGIRSVSAYHSHFIVISDQQEIQIFDKKFRPSSFLHAEISRFSGMRATTSSISGEGSLWIGTDGNGLIKIFPGKNYFGLISGSNGYEFNKPVRTFAEVNGDLWVGTKGKGIIRLNDFWNQREHIRKPELLNTSNGLNNNSVFTLKKGADSYIYIGTDGKGISIYDLKSNKTVNWADIKNSSSFPAFGSVYAILQDRDSSLWLGTSGSGLIHVKLNSTATGELHIKYLRQYLSEKTQGLANDIIYALTATDDRYLWIACRYGGLSVLDKLTGKFRIFRASGQAGSLSNNDVLSLCRDRNGSLWIGTSFGLNYLDRKELLKGKPWFKKFTLNDGLPNNTIHAIEQSETGELWLSTNKGLARLKPATGNITTFNESDGLQSNEFSDGAVMKSSRGYLFFGGIYGFNYFLPQNVRGNNEAANLLVSQLQVGGRDLNENQLQVLKPHTRTATIPAYETERKMNFFRLSLKSISFINPIKNEFNYKLDGFDKTWNYSGSNGNIIYNNITPGDYTLLVRWADQDGNWTKPVPVIKLTVKQYFWLSYPALGFYLIVLLLSGYLFHLYRKNRIEMKYQLQMEYQLRQKDEVAHQQRLNFFTNIAHEIQTPLTLIMGSIEHFLTSRKNELWKNKQNSYFLSLVHQHSVRLTYLVQQLLEFRKAEAGFLRKTNNYIDISKMLNSLTSLFLTESEKSGKPYIIEIEEGIAGFTDKDKLEKILFNLLSNAFKHSEAGARITFRASYNRNSEMLNIDVSNTGCRLRNEDLQNIFSNFYTKGGTSHGTGIGLAFAKELATLLDAKITAGLTTENTITFTLSAPVAATSDKIRDNEVATSAPSYLYEALLQHHEQPILNSEEENKNSLIQDLHQKSKYSILIVEDDPELRFLLRDVLKNQYIVYESSNGVEALSFLKKFTPDLIISDVMMPDMDGLTLCNEIKNTPATAQIPFIILSAKGSEENKQEGYEVGADAYIPKPFNLNYLQVRIRKLLDYHVKMQNLIKDQNIANQFTNTDIADSDKQFLESILRVIEKNLDDPDLSSSTIEDELAISKMQLYRKLKSLAGMTPAEFIKRVRLKHASDMLLHSNFTVSEIIYKTGFNSKSYFFREFKKIYLCAPNDYRAKQHEVSLKED